MNGWEKRILDLFWDFINYRITYDDVIKEIKQELRDFGEMVVEWSSSPNEAEIIVNKLLKDRNIEEI